MALSAAVTNALAALQAAIEGAGTLQNAPPQVLAPVIAAANNAVTAINTQIAELDASIIETSVGGIAVGMPVPLMISTLIAQTQAVMDDSTLQQLLGFVTRILANLVNAPG
jgi:hypothetical protein